MCEFGRLFDSLPFQVLSETSNAAAESMRPSAPTDRAAVLELLSRKLGGLTDEELQRSLKMNANTERPRRIELVSSGKVRDSGKKRKTLSGRAATIWEVA